MEIAHSTLRSALACGGNEACETLRLAKPGEAGWHLSTPKMRAQRKRTRFGLVILAMVAILPGMVKPATDGNGMGRWTRQAIRGDWGGRVLKVWHQVWGGPILQLDKKGMSNNNDRESITCMLANWESERLIVAEKRGNTSRAKGPYHTHVCMEKRRPA